MNFTDQQKAAIDARGNVLVVAGAGTGKTRTLVERCLSLLLDQSNPASLENILLVTFTEAAAAEMRKRIRLRIEEELARSPENFELEKQLALFDTAHIGTLHGFCLKLIRQYFYKLELDPQLAVLPEEEARLLADETLDDMLQRHYAGDDALAEALQGLIQTQGRGRDQPVRALVFQLHNYTQTLPDPAGWFEDQMQMFKSPEPSQWRTWLEEFAANWRDESLNFLNPLAGNNELAAKAAAVLKTLSERFSRAEFATTLERLAEIPGECPPKKKTLLLGPLKDFFAAAEFLGSLGCAPGDADPLAEDWNWSRANMLALLRLAREFGERFSAAKLELGALDFHDLEQHTLRLLWDRATNQPTGIASEWRKRLRFIFVDEYQDINAAQDKIIEALSGEGEQANRFLVGDIKQSIYRFRLADPRIFQNYSETWRGKLGRTIPLTKNFRSREGVLDFVNSLFAHVMQREAGGLAYDDQARLRFGGTQKSSALGSSENASPCVELHLRIIDGENEPREEDFGAPAGVAEPEDTNLEARLVALRLRELKEQAHPIWDEKQEVFRAVEWGDMAVLLRSPGSKAEVFAKEFSQLGVPLIVARGGFFGSLEISDLLNLLRLLDNPLQDLPALAVLHSPLVGLSVDELAVIRLAAAKVPFWTALLRWRDLEKAEGGGRKAETGKTETARKGAAHGSQFMIHAAGTLEKVDLLIARYARWRHLVRQVSLSRCLEAVLAETHYSDGLLTQPRGEQRRANVRRLLYLTQRFDQFQRQGLFRFLRFVEAQQAAELEPAVAAAAEENAVRMMSIHQSKGLEFPVVVVANLAKQFNFSDLQADLILDDQFGLGPQIKPPHTGRRYPSLPHWLAQRRQRFETLGEELRLLYVAATRARDTLVLTASITERKFESQWNEPDEASAARLLSARSYADWLAMWFAKNCAGPGKASRAGQSPLLRWEISGGAGLVSPPASKEEAPAAEEFAADDQTLDVLARRLASVYPFAAASAKAAKVSVSTLRREAAEEEAETWSLPKVQSSKSKARGRSLRADGNSAADIGTAHHRFLQAVSLDQAGSALELEREAARMGRENYLTAEEIAVLDFQALAGFWVSELGLKIRAQAGCVRRELAFTARFPLKELGAITGQTPDAALAEEFVVVQGVADLVVILEAEIWLVDFKTDDVGRDGLAAKARTYEPQLRLYSLALARIYGKPVTQCWLYFLALREAVPMQP